MTSPYNECKQIAKIKTCKRNHVRAKYNILTANENQWDNIWVRVNLHVVCMCEYHAMKIFGIKHFHRSECA